jgi:hypothetical protein
MIRTINPSQLRDPEVLAEAANRPINIFDAKRETELILGSRTTWDTEHSLLHGYSLLLANCVVELPDERPSAVALGLLGFAASWDLADRMWLLRQLADVYAASVRVESTKPIADFIAFVGQKRTVTDARITAPIEPKSLPKALLKKLKPRPV